MSSRNRPRCAAFPAHNTVQAATEILMTNDTNPSGKADTAKQPGLEEARLRQQAIGVKLRHLFDDVVNEPVPDEFLDILRRADERGSDKA